MNVCLHEMHLSGTFKVMIDEAVFRHAADGALDSLFKALNRAGEEFEFDADMNSGALTVEFEDPPAKFVVSPNTPVRQIWVSAHSRSFKLDWDESSKSFVLLETGDSLNELMGKHISEQLGETVAL